MLFALFRFSDNVSSCRRLADASRQDRTLGILVPLRSILRQCSILARRYPPAAFSHHPPALSQARCRDMAMPGKRNLSSHSSHVSNISLPRALAYTLLPIQDRAVRRRRPSARDDSWWSAPVVQRKVGRRVSGYSQWVDYSVRSNGYGVHGRLMPSEMVAGIWYSFTFV